MLGAGLATDPASQRSYTEHANIKKPLFHVFLNTPRGHEHLKQAAAFAELLGLPLSVYFPTALEFLLHLDGTVLTVPLGRHYLSGRDTAHQRVGQLTRPFDICVECYRPSSYTGGVVPDVQADWSAMTCPRLVSAGLARGGCRGPSVGQLVGRADFPLFVPCGIAVDWTSVSVLFDDSASSGKALVLGREVARRTGTPCSVYEVSPRATRDADGGLARLDPEVLPARRKSVATAAAENTRTTCLEPDSLVVVGVRGRPWWSRWRPGLREELTDTIPNPLLVVGGKCRVQDFSDESLVP